MATSGTTAVLAVVLVIGSCVLAGCGGNDNPYALSEYAGRATTSAPATAGTRGPQRSSSPIRVSRAATPPPQVHYRPADAGGRGAWVERGRIEARTAGERRVVDAVVAYITVRVQLSNTWQVDEQALAASASGQAITDARARAARQRDQGLRSTGRFVLNLSSVQVQGDRARVTGCDFDATSEVDDETGIPEIAPVGGVRITMRLQRIDGSWRVLDWPTKPVPSCDDWRRR